MSKRDRQIQDPFEQQQDGSEPIDQPEPDGFTYQKITWTAKDDVAPTGEPPVTDRPTADGAEPAEFTAVEPTLGGLDKASPDMEWGLLDASTPKVRKDSGDAHLGLCNNENIEADVVGQAVEQGLADAGRFTEQPDQQLDYLTITMTNVVDDAVDG